MSHKNIEYNKTTTIRRSNTLLLILSLLYLSILGLESLHNFSHKYYYYYEVLGTHCSNNDDYTASSDSHNFDKCQICQVMHMQVDYFSTKEISVVSIFSKEQKSKLLTFEFTLDTPKLLKSRGPPYRL